MAENEEKSRKETWKRFLKRHWKMTLLIAGGIVGAVVAAIFVFLWVIAGLPAAGYPTTLGAWTIGYCISFFLRLIGFELLLVGSWVIAAAILIYTLWYRHLPIEEREEYEKQDKKHKSRDGGRAISFIVFLTWLIVVWVDARWNLAFSSWTVNMWVYSWIAALLWDLLIIGVPVIIAVTIWLRREIKELP